MKGDPKIITYLNRILTNQLTAINQYFLHARMLRDWGVEEMGEYEYKLSIKEMKRADAVVTDITTQMCQRNKNLFRIRDRVLVTRIADATGDIHQGSRVFKIGEPEDLFVLESSRCCFCEKLFAIHLSAPIL